MTGPDRYGALADKIREQYLELEKVKETIKRWDADYARLLLEHERQASIANAAAFDLGQMLEWIENYDGDIARAIDGMFEVFLGVHAREQWNGVWHRVVEAHENHALAHCGQSIEASRFATNPSEIDREPLYCGKCLKSRAPQKVVAQSRPPVKEGNCEHGEPWSGHCQACGYPYGR